MMRKRGLITLMAVAPVWTVLYFWGSSLEIKHEGWFTIFPPEMEHIRIGMFVAAITTLCGIGLLIADIVRWLSEKRKSNA